ncbi:MAG: hypothetical protein FWG78_01380 [Coriobacteriia bacterium]|nr:hypothetical protein [Coriobacteriia bacterium]
MEKQKTPLGTKWWVAGLSLVRGVAIFVLTVFFFGFSAIFGTVALPTALPRPYVYSLLLLIPAIGLSALVLRQPHIGRKQKYVAWTAAVLAGVSLAAFLRLLSMFSPA